MIYQGEQLIFGILGKSFIYIATLSALIATYFFFKIFHQQKENKLQDCRIYRVGNMLLWIHVVATWAAFALLFYLLLGHYYQYQYVWQHSSNSLSKAYLLSAMWEGQEGSFLLWVICQSTIIAIFLLQKNTLLKPGILAVIAFAQVLLMTNILGVFHLGLNPFELLRTTIQDPIFNNPHYVSMIADGRGLNRLLQNYWMVIHPPFLFMGFALCIVPFAFVITSLWKKNFTQWIQPTLIWGVMAMCILGCGLIMGAAWAYEDLNFGGYWAWDPVENSSLVPWLVGIAGIHALLIAKHTKQAQKTALFFLGITYILVLYSTYLTRSGILGNTSVHSFTDMNLGWHLLFIIALQLIPFLILYCRNKKYVLNVHAEENILSREFFMLIGALLIILCSIYIIGATSLPVFNKIFGTHFALGENAIYTYNRVLVWALSVISFLIAIGQYLKYKNTQTTYLLKKIFLPTCIAMILFLIVLMFSLFPMLRYGYIYWVAICLAILFSIYALVNNVSYIFNVLKGKITKIGSALSHAGFALMMLGALIAASQKKAISNTQVANFQLSEHTTGMMADNVTFIKNQIMPMGKYLVTYLQDSIDLNTEKQYYQLEFKDTELTSTFSLYPNVYINNMPGMEGLMTSPSTKHFWNQDLFVYVSSIPKPVEMKDYPIHTFKKGDTLFK
ncbi:MAG: cytochrome c biogenesis protein CcsA, partial [Chitinophagaceae bacterium]